jgi:hypothetical protein
MNVGILKNNTKYYDGFESDTEITLSIVENSEYNIHIYEGYFTDFFGSPEVDGKGWNGFTRDYNQMERTFGDEDYVISDVKEYLEDMISYADKKFEDEDTTQCYILLKKFLEYAINHNYHINVHVF